MRYPKEISAIYYYYISFLSDNNQEDGIGYRRGSKSSHSLESEDEYQVESERVSQSIRF